MPDDLTWRHAQTARDFVELHQDEMVAQLEEWVRLPSVDAAAEHADDLRRSADWLAEDFRATGLPVSEVWETVGQPAILAEWPCLTPARSRCSSTATTTCTCAPCAPRTGARQHPSTRSSATARSTATELRGRGTTHQPPVGLRAHLALCGTDAPVLHLKFLVEGEEETGAGHLGENLRQHCDRLAADLVIHTDTMLWRKDAPAECLGIRGAVPAHLTVRGPHRA